MLYKKENISVTGRIMEVFKPKSTKIYFVVDLIRYIFNIQLLLMHFLHVPGFVGDHLSGITPCDRSRKVLTDSWGVITDGPPGSNYTQDSHCEWLIKANNSKQFITLTFASMGTECSYDYIFIHDGESFDSPLLASFSGRTKPQSITAKSGAMLILLYSDTNYVLDGFQAEYSITNCPHNCSNRGVCVDRLKDGHFKCICGSEDGMGHIPLYGGSDCAVSLCPDDCGASQMHGTCNYSTAQASFDAKHREARCICNEGYSGESCSLPNKDMMGNRWHWLSRHSRGPSPKVAAHSAVYVGGTTDALFVFGGFDLNHVYGQLWAYHFSGSHWELIDGLPMESKVEREKDEVSKEGSIHRINSVHFPSSHNISPVVREFNFSVTGNLTVSIRAKVRTDRDISELTKNMKKRTDELTSFKNMESNTSDGLFGSDKGASRATPEGGGERREGGGKPREEEMKPSPRYGHAACSYLGGFLLYGGKLSNGSLSNELWFYDVALNKWSLRGMKSKFHPPPLTRHTLTLGADGWVYLFGGSTVPWKTEDGVGAGLRGVGAPGEFSSSLYRIRLSHFSFHNHHLHEGDESIHEEKGNADRVTKTEWPKLFVEEKSTNDSNEKNGFAEETSLTSDNKGHLGYNDLLNLSSEANRDNASTSVRRDAENESNQDDEEMKLRVAQDEVEMWEEIRPRGGKTLDVRVAAHSTVYYALSNSLLVFGGVVAGGTARFSRLSDRLFAYHLDEGHWAELRGYPAQRPVLRDPYVPGERAFHTGTVVGNYLVIFGGYSHRHNKDEICYDNQMYFYHLGCHTWVSHEILPNVEKDRGYPKSQGVFAHAADIRNGNTLLVFGGYHGNVNGDLLAYSLPPTIAPGSGVSAENFCSNHQNILECTSDPECGWCSADETCYGRTLTANCTTNLQTTRCPGICPALGDCHSCLIHGDFGKLNKESSSKLVKSQVPISIAHKLHLGQCTWCVQNARCHHRDDNFGVCGTQEDAAAGGDGPMGWWGSVGTEVLQVQDCRTLDHRPGLTFLKYKHPADYDHPDYVGIINATTADFNLPGAFGTRTELPLVGEVRARLLGFIWPPQITSIHQSPIPLASAPNGATIKICASYSSTMLAVSRPHTHPPKLELVANLTAELSTCTLARWLQSSGLPVILQRLESRPEHEVNDDDSHLLWNGKHLVDFEARKTARSSGPYAAHHLSKMELLYNYSSDDSAKVFTFEYLEPYSNGTCSSYHNCLHCLTDSMCGWCETVGKCMSRSVNETEECVYPPRSNSDAGMMKTEWRYLTLLPSSCPNCSNFVSCETCTSAGDICEWWTEDARCARRGRSPDAVVSLHSCPSPCHHRRSCSECLGEAGRCVWCDTTQECFSFSVYTSEYQFGLCREWIDQDYNYLQPLHSSQAPSSSSQSPPQRHRLGDVTNLRTSEPREGSNGTIDSKLLPVTEQCRSCDRHLNCSSCLRSLGCGWCYSKTDPTIGACVRGDFNKPYSGSCAFILAYLNFTQNNVKNNHGTESPYHLNMHSIPGVNSFPNKMKAQGEELKLSSSHNKVFISDNLSPASANHSSTTMDPDVSSEEYYPFSEHTHSTSQHEIIENEDKKQEIGYMLNKSMGSTVVNVRSIIRPLSSKNKDIPNVRAGFQKEVNHFAEEDWLWAYSECPDVDECASGKHICHLKAECRNTHGSYHCLCHRGYVGDGITSCNKTCYEECSNGFCVGEPEFQCHCYLGWTGPDCATDCQCHNHSTCDGSTGPTAGMEGFSREIGPGHCDECQGWTWGEFCEQCRPGSYGDPKTGKGCRVCHCNGHGDEKKGLCDRRNGTCFCTGNTFGDACDTCERGYYGDPRNGGNCYSECGPRVVLSGVMSGGIGSENVLEPRSFSSQHLSKPISMRPSPTYEQNHSSSFDAPIAPGPPRDCLWIIDPNGKLAKQNADVNKTDVSTSPVIIQLMLAKGSVAGVKCGEGSVHIYDGLPAFVTSMSSLSSPSLPSSASSLHSHSLGAFCDHDATYPLTVEAKSGLMTVFFQKRGRTQLQLEMLSHQNFEKVVEGFNVTFKVLACPNNCPQGRICQESFAGLWGNCACPDGYSGPNCDQKLCDSGLCQMSSFREEILGRKYYPQLTTLFDTASLTDSLDHLRRILPRFGHSLVADRRGALWIFGGYSLSHGLLNDIRMFDTKNSTWIQVTVDSTGDASMPQGRYFHAAACVHSRREVYIYGGLASGGRALDDLWMFGVKNHRWTKIETIFGPPPVAGHSLTFRWGNSHYSGVMGSSSSLRKVAESEGGAALEDGEEDREEEQEEGMAALGAEKGDGIRGRDWGEGSLVLIGGFGPKEGFLHSCWEYHLRWGTWRQLNTTGKPPIGIYGHTTVYHAPTESFYVYGGYSYSINHTFISNKLYALHYPSGIWSLLPPFEEYNPPGLFLPRARFLHSAITTNEYMLILGGRTHPVNSSNGIDAYVYSCNLWIHLGSKDFGPTGDLDWTLGKTAALLPRTGHIAVRAQGGNDNIQVYLFGGFEEGGTRAKVTQMILPKDLCSLWQEEGKDRCRGTLGCSYCGVVFTSESDGNSGSNVSVCYSSSRSLPDECRVVGGIVTTNNGATCDQEWLERRNCEQYTTCSECLAHWPFHPRGKQVCQWCSNCPNGRCVRRGQDCNEGIASNHATAAGRVRVGTGCSVRQTAVTDVSFCPGYSCPASDCSHCMKLHGCIWTRQVLLTPELGLKVSAEPVHEWSCVRDDVLGRSSIRLVSSSPPAPCPPRCSSHRTCRKCLSAPGGGEGGWRECRWSPLLGECISPSYQPLYCAGGVCGLVLHGSPSQCPSPCSHFKQCATCLQDPRCGWCSLESIDDTTGVGVCSEGSLEGPSPISSVMATSTCHALYLRAKDNETASQNFRESENSESVDLGFKFSWHYLFCPPEDECQNGHHSCHPEAELCVDLAVGFNCVCGEGYMEERRGCVPVCNPGCVHGWCAKPNICQCDFGYVGQDCSLKCQCNEHSNCEGPDKLDNCTQCHNNTMGPRCERCLPKFVGDPTNGGECVPCLDYCNGHTPHCVNVSSSEPYQYLSKQLEVEDSMLLKWNNNILGTNNEGSLRATALCIGCANGTAGEKCEGCLSGYFRGSTDHRQPCRLCECHGHGDICDPITGEHCNCQNNTESDPQCLSGATNALAVVSHSPQPLSGQPLGDNILISSGHVSKASRPGSSNTVVHQEKSGMLLGNQQLQPQQTQCWKLQCSKCREYYVGSPTNGHQCYRQMVVDSEYCFDPKTQEDCTGKPHPLLPGRTSFLVVQPRFMNVDIRLTVDVTQGGLDLFLSPREDAFTIQINDSTGYHMVELDPRFRIRREDSTNEEMGIFKDEPDGGMKDDGGDLSFMSSSNGPRVPSRAYLQRGNSVAGPISLLPRFTVIERQASGLATYITLDDPYFILVVRNLRNRLVLTLPQAAHDLGSTRFHIALLGQVAEDGGGDYEESGDERNADGSGDRGWKPGRSAWEQTSRSKRSLNNKNPSLHATTFGIAFFRQDQLHIDLFVFFSVFFSCFFLFLASVVVAWRAKRAADARRARRQHVVQMLHLAQRPFASVSLYLDSALVEEVYQCSPSHSSEEGSEEVEYGEGSEGLVVRCRKQGSRCWGGAPEHLSHPGQVCNSGRPSSPARAPLALVTGSEDSPVPDAPIYKKLCTQPQQTLGGKLGLSKGSVHGVVRPIAVEPTEDGVAGVATVFVKLPGGNQAPVRIALASSLILLSRVYPVNGRAFLRRRSSGHQHQHHYHHQGAV